MLWKVFHPLTGCTVCWFTSWKIFLNEDRKVKFTSLKHSILSRNDLAKDHIKLRNCTSAITNIDIYIQVFFQYPKEPLHTGSILEENLSQIKFKLIHTNMYL